MTTNSAPFIPWTLTRPPAPAGEIDWEDRVVPLHMEDWAEVRQLLHDLMLLFDGEMRAATEAHDHRTAAWNAICAHHTQELVDAIGHLFRGILPAVE